MHWFAVLQRTLCSRCCSSLARLMEEYQRHNSCHPISTIDPKIRLKTHGDPSQPLQDFPFMFFGTYTCIISIRISQSFKASKHAKITQAFICLLFLVLLIIRTTAACQDLKWIEFFAGRAEATRAHKLAGYTSAKLDINFFTEPEGTRGSGNNYYDILTPAGFAKRPQLIQVDGF